MHASMSHGPDRTTAATSSRSSPLARLCAHTARMLTRDRGLLTGSPAAPWRHFGHLCNRDAMSCVTSSRARTSSARARSTLVRHLRESRRAPQQAHRLRLLVRDRRLQVPRERLLELGQGPPIRRVSRLSRLPPQVVLPLARVRRPQASRGLPRMRPAQPRPGPLLRVRVLQVRHRRARFHRQPPLQRRPRTQEVHRRVSRLHALAMVQSTQGRRR